MVVIALVLGPLCALASHRLDRSRLQALVAALAGCALAPVISLTLLRGGGLPGQLVRLRGCALTDPAPLSGDGLVNLLLLAPAAFLAVLAIGRPLLVATGALLLSLAIETLQAVLAVGVCDSSDALLNTLGALAAALVGAALRAAFVPGSDPCPRSC
jgi:hypothetical protein